jgi:hypothetical protein
MRNMALQHYSVFFLFDEEKHLNSFEGCFSETEGGGLVGQCKMLMFIG